jgi:hypothetical protein
MLKPLSKKLKILQNAGKAGWKPFQTLSCLECIVSISNRRTLQGSSSLTFISRWGLCFLVWRMTWQEDIQLIKTLNSNSLCASKLTPRYDTKVHWKPGVRLGRVMESLHQCCYDATCVPNHIFLFFLNNYFLIFYVVIKNIIFKK